MALNGELKALGGRLLESARTAPDYKLYALDTTPPKPGMLRVEAGAGSSIELEVWALGAASFGKFVAAIPPPLSIGTVRLADGRGVKGFIVEPADIAGARDISAFNGWRAFVTEAAAGEPTNLHPQSRARGATANESGGWISRPRPEAPTATTSIPTPRSYRN